MAFPPQGIRRHADMKVEAAVARETSCKKGERKREGETRGTDRTTSSLQLPFGLGPGPIFGGGIVLSGLDGLILGGQSEQSGTEQVQLSSVGLR